MESNWKEKISTPALVVDYDLMQKNIRTMAKFARDQNIDLRPHVKTHKCPKIAKMMLDSGASGICVAKVGEAEIFAKAGLNDILIANQVIDLGQIKRLIELNKNSLVRVCVDSEKNVRELNKAALKEKITLEVVLEVDVGLGRNGVQPGQPALDFAKILKNQENLNLVGLQGYEGHLISIVDPEIRKQQAHDCMQLLVDTRDILVDNGFDIQYLTGGNTATYRFTGTHKGITEIQPGTYVFSDEHLQRVNPIFKPAVTVLSTIQNQTGKKEFTIDAGTKAIPIGDGKPIVKNFPKIKFRVMNEEHTQLKALGAEFEIGQKIELIPAHVCITINVYDYIHVIKNNEYIGRWEILARGKNY